MMYCLQTLHLRKSNRGFPVWTCSSSRLQTKGKMPALSSADRPRGQKQPCKNAALWGFDMTCQMQFGFLVSIDRLHIEKGFSITG